MVAIDNDGPRISLLKEPATESCSAEGDKEELLQLFSDYLENILSLLRLAQNIKLWQLRDQDPLPTYIKNCAILIGDAARPMTPHQGQGGTQAVEDAEAFRLFLGPGATRDRVTHILRDIDSIRRPRASQIQENTRKAANKRSAEEMFAFEQFNWTYAGIRESLRLIGGRRMMSGYGGRDIVSFQLCSCVSFLIMKRYTVSRQRLAGGFFAR